MKKILSTIIISCFLLGGLAACKSSVDPSSTSTLYDAQPTQAPISAYKDVLQNKTELTTTSYAESGTKTIYLDQLLKEGVNTFQFINFAVLDMDGDNMNEVVIQYGLTDSDQYPEYVEVLHYSEGTVYGYNFSYRGLYGLKEDGSFNWSNGADDNGYATLQFSSNNAEYVNIAYQKPNLTTVPYVINNQTVTESEYDAFIKKQEDKKDVTWYDFTNENMEAQLSDIDYNDISQ